MIIISILKQHFKLQSEGNSKREAILQIQNQKLREESIPSATQKAELPNDTLR